MKLKNTTRIIAFIGICLSPAACSLIEERVVFHTVPRIIRPGGHAIEIRSSTARVKVWTLHETLQPALIYFGGTGEDVSSCLRSFDVTFPGRAVYLVTYRGHAGSHGHASEAAVVEDARAIYDWVAARHDRVTVMGRSLGTGVATALAASRPVEKLVLVTPFDSLTNVAAEYVPWLPVRWLLRHDRFDSIHRIGSVHAPILVLIAGRDEVISRAHTDALVAAIPALLRHTVVIPEATHQTVTSLPAYRQHVGSFVDPIQRLGSR